MTALLKTEIVTVLEGSEFSRRRKAEGLTLKHVAERTGLSESFICDVERGRRIAKGDTAKRIAATVGR